MTCPNCGDTGVFQYEGGEMRCPCVAHPARLSTSDMDRIAERALHDVSTGEPLPAEQVRRLCSIIIHMTSRFALARHALTGED
jgi:hypothetical protein